MSLHAALTRALEELDTAARLLEEALTIGLWSGSDDSGDDRRKRQALREVHWAVSGAHRAVASVADAPEEVRALQQEFRALQTAAEELADREPSDGMNLEMQRKVGELRGRVADSLAAAAGRA